MASPAREAAPFLPYIHTFRAVAIVAVVASHLDASWSNLTLGERVALSMSRDASVLFLFVAGFLFQYLSRGFAYGKYLKSKLQNVIAPYMVVSIPALLHQYHHHWGVFGAEFPRRFSNPFLHAASTLVTAEPMPAPLWFIPMISCLYLAAPLLIAVDRRPRLYWLTLPLVIAAMLCHRPLPVNRIGQACLYFTPAYVAGMWFSHYRQRCMDFISTHLGLLFAIWAVAELVGVFVLGHTGPIFSQAPFSIEHGIVDVNLPDKILLSFCLVGLLARYETVIGHRLDYLAGASFGVFFVHGYVIKLVWWEMVKWRYAETPLELTRALVFIPLYVLASLLVVAAVRAITGRHSRYIVGC